mmetsp:Transcript_9732/g.17139  ORF Transcript_9732/g.17139 Transcript_9732/m.17139 type:complete len:426 (-) Transcript_9732:23-1300(-)
MNLSSRIRRESFRGELELDTGEQDYGTLSSASARNTIGLRRLGSDTPLVVLVTILFSMPLCTFGLNSEWLVSFLSLAYGVALPVLFLALSHGRPGRWQLYNYWCLFSTFLGAGVGGALRDKDVFGKRKPIFVMLLVVSYLLSTFFLMKIKDWSGYYLIGSSVHFKEKYGWGWNKKAAAQMLFGIDRSGESGFHLMVDKFKVYPKFVAHGLLHNRCCWSGEPAMDYIFSLANDHSWIGCLFCHPAHPYDRFERIAVLGMLCLLIVFPVAAFTVAFENENLRQIFIILVVTGPRNILKKVLLSVVLIEDVEILRELDKENDEEIDPEKINRKVEESEEVKRAYLGEEIFFFCTALFTGFVTLFCCLYLRRKGELTGALLLYSSVGMVYFFVLEFIFHCFAPRFVHGKLLWGFFGRWWSERLSFDDTA